jgi:hypothetical protein
MKERAKRFYGPNARRQYTALVECADCGAQIVGPPKGARQKDDETRKDVADRARDSALRAARQAARGHECTTQPLRPCPACEGNDDDCGVCDGSGSVVDRLGFTEWRYTTGQTG